MNLLELSSNLSGKKCIVCLHTKEEHPVFVFKNVASYGVDYDYENVIIRLSRESLASGYIFCEEFRESVQLQLF